MQQVSSDGGGGGGAIIIVVSDGVVGDGQDSNPSILLGGVALALQLGWPSGA